MKKIISNRITAPVVALVILTSSATAQTGKDTVTTGKANDKMVVKPGTHQDQEMVVKAAPANDGAVVLSDTGFINKNINDNYIEVQVSKMALSKGTGSQIRKIATQLMAEHNQMLADFRQLAEKKGAIKRAAGMMPGSDLPQVPSLKVQPSTNFNAAWASFMLTMHEDKIVEMEKYLAITQDEDLKTLIGTSLPKIRRHRDMLKQIPGAKVVSGENTVTQ